MTNELPAVNFHVQSHLWDNEDYEDLTLKALTAALSILPENLESSELSFVLSDNAFIHELNRSYRNVDKPTNVLSFPADAEPVTSEEEPKALGDIILAFETIAQEAEQQNKPFQNHLSHLIVHGFLHLLGYDHEEEDEAIEMESLEIQILSSLNIPDPYHGDTP